jgi:excisionase family DNA binding protein
MSTRTKRLTMTIPEAAEKLGIGRNQGYAAAKSGQIPTIKVGNRILVPVVALENKLLNASSSGRRTFTTSDN